MEGDSLVRYKSRRQRYFYPRPHMEGDYRMVVGGANGIDFYPRPHMEGDITVYVPLWMSTDFYPRPHMEGDGQSGSILDVYGGISTHALTWRATRTVF